MNHGDNGGPAFPQACHGMTLRDWFAGQALSGAMRVCMLKRASKRDDDSMWPKGWHDEDAAKLAYEIADKMLKARRAPQRPASPFTAQPGDERSNQGEPVHEQQTT